MKTMQHWLGQALRRGGPALLVASVALLLWQIVIWSGALPTFLFPSPAQVWTAATEHREALMRGALTTGLTSLCGLSIAIFLGSLLAVIFSQSAALRTAFYPYVIFLQTVPIVAIAPLMIIWFGYRPLTVALISAIICFFPIVSNVTAGLLALEPNHRDLFRIYGAGRFTTLWRLQIPNAIGYLALGTRISCGLAVIGTIVGEFFVGSGSQYAGLGSLMSRWQTLQWTDALMAGVCVSTLLGLAMFGSVNLLFATLLKRWTQRVTG